MTSPPAWPEPPYDLLVDQRTGIVTSLDRYLLSASDGRSLTYWQADAADTSVWAHASSGQATGGCHHLGDRARAAAVGEAVERYCGHLVDHTRTIRASYGDLVADAQAAVDPDSLCLHGEPNGTGDPFVGLDRSSTCSWVAGTNPAGPQVWVPAALVWLAYGSHSCSDTGPVCYPVPGGIAAGPTPAAARRGALGETVERHALATAWYGDRPFGVIEAGRIWTVPNRWDWPVVLVDHHRGSAGPLALGCAADADLATAVDKASAEAAMVARTLELVAAGGLDWHSSGVLAAPTAQHRYLEHYGPDLAGAVDLACHLQLGLDPRVQAAQRERLGRLGGVATPSRPDDDLDDVLARDGRVPLTIELTTDDMAMLGLAVVRVVVPGLRPLGPTAYGFFGAGVDPLPSVRCRVVIPHA